METISNIFHYTYGGPELFVLFFAFIVAPIVFYLLNKVLKKRLSAVVAVLIIIASIFAAYTDVYFIAKEAERLCREEAGLHVYKTVEAEGFLGGISIDYWSKYGFKYVEKEYAGGDKYRYIINEKGEILNQPVDIFISQYEYVQDLEILDKPFNKSTKRVIDRVSGNVLAELVSFAVYPGWLDSRFLGFIGFSWSPKACDGDYLPGRGKLKYSASNFIKSVIKPKFNKGD